MLMDVHHLKHDVKLSLGKIEACSSSTEKSKVERAANIMLTFFKKCVNDSVFNKIPPWLSSPKSLETMILNDVKFGSQENDIK